MPNYKGMDSTNQTVEAAINKRYPHGVTMTSDPAYVGATAYADYLQECLDADRNGQPPPTRKAPPINFPPWAVGFYSEDNPDEPHVNGLPISDPFTTYHVGIDSLYGASTDPKLRLDHMSDSQLWNAKTRNLTPLQRKFGQIRAEGERTVPDDRFIQTIPDKYAYTVGSAEGGFMVADKRYPNAVATVNAWKTISDGTPEQIEKLSMPPTDFPSWALEERPRVGATREEIKEANLGNYISQRMPDENDPSIRKKSMAELDAASAALAAQIPPQTSVQMQSGPSGSRASDARASPKP